MSAYICAPEHTGALAAFAAQHNSAIHECCGSGLSTIDIAKSVASLLMQANVDSVAYRYSEKNTSDPKRSLKTEIFAALYMLHPPALQPIDIIRMAGCLEYQSCEHPTWDGSRAKKQLSWILNAAIQQLPGYQTAVRDFSES